VIHNEMQMESMLTRKVFACSEGFYFVWWYIFLGCLFVSDKSLFWILYVQT